MASNASLEADALAGASDAELDPVTHPNLTKRILVKKYFKMKIYLAFQLRRQKH